jgi:hypothetical protein
MLRLLPRHPGYSSLGSSRLVLPCHSAPDDTSHRPVQAAHDVVLLPLEVLRVLDPFKMAAILEEQKAVSERSKV